MKKKIIICLVILAVLIIIGFLVYRNSNYCVDKIKEILNSGKTSTNMHVSIEQTNLNDGKKYYLDLYRKDNLFYIIGKNDESEVEQEILYNEKDEKTLTILHEQKEIINSNQIENNISTYIFDSGKSNFLMLLDNTKGIKYKYHGKENVNGKECLKVSLIDEKNEEKKSQNYYYIDLENNNNVIKYEYYEGESINELNKKHEELYTYSYDTVTDDDILQFDINNYPDYKYYE